MLSRNELSNHVFLAGIFISTLLVSPFAIDANLSLRSISLSITLLFSFALLKFPTKKIKLDLITLSFLVFTLYSISSVFWALNLAEAFYSTCRDVFLFGVFFLALYQLKYNKEWFYSRFLKLSSILTLFAILGGVIQISTIHSFSKDVFYQITSLYAHKNLFSSFLFLNLFFLLLSALSFQGLWKSIAYIAIAGSLIMLLLLRTKAVWLAFGVSTLFFLTLLKFPLGAWLQKKKSFYLFLVLLIILSNVFMLKVLPEILSKTLSKSYSAEQNMPNLKSIDEERLILWDKTYAMIKAQPLTGVGNGNWQTFFPNSTLNGIWRAEDLDVTFQRPHNDFLWIISEKGILGFNLFLIPIFSLLLLLFSNVQDKKVKKENLLFYPLAVSFILGFLINSFFDFPKERVEHGILFSVLLAFSHCLVSTKDFFPSYGSFAFKPFYKYTILFASLLAVLISSLHLKGEYFSRKMYQYSAGNAPYKVIEEGNKALSFAYATDPTSLPIHWYLGNAYAATANYQDALISFEKAYKLCPFERRVLNDLASAYVHNNYTKGAKPLYAEAARISPRFDEPKLNLAAIYIQEKNFDEATFWLNSILHDSERRTNYYKIIEIQKGQN